MTPSPIRSFGWLFMTLVFIGVLCAQPDPVVEKEAGSSPIPPQRSFVTRHSAMVAGHPVSYRVQAGEIYLRDAENQPSASIFSFAYLKEDVEDPATRPVTFAWNGGPGSSSIWLHLGSFGPVRAVVPSDARDAGAPPYRLEPNQSSLLDVTDLVFIDPVGTGFSHALGEHQNRDFWGLREDAQSVADFIRAWLSENRRWNSPKYLLGESYGTTRAAAVAGILEGERPTVSLNGLILISQALDYTGSTPAPNNLIGFVTYLPTMAATAWYHKKVPGAPGDLRKFVDEAREFTVREYAPALFMGSRLDAASRARVRDRLVYFTGLSPEYIESAGLRVLGRRFLKELLRREGMAIGRLDSRYLGDDVDDLSENPEGDAARWATSGAYTALFNDYLVRELEVNMDRTYNVAAGSEASRNWNFRPVPQGQRWEPSYINTAPDLSQALRQNSGLRVLVASGYFDFATPFFDAEYTFGRHGILPERVTMTFYESGHMLYLHDPSRLQLVQDIRSFFQKK